jgi:HK97 gp10 family phage protein
VGIKYTLQVAKAQKLRAALKQLPEDMRKGVKKALRESAMAVRKDARKRVAVRTKALRKSISFKVAKDGLSAKVFPKKHYGTWVEHGREGQEAQPFMRPAAEAERPRFPKRISKDVHDALKAYRK